MACTVSRRPDGGASIACGRQARGDELVEFADVRVVRETKPGMKNQGALLVLVDGAERWVPKSLIHEDSEVYKAGTLGTLIVGRWFAEKEGWV